MAKKKTLDEFISDARLVHGDKYDYSKSIYINTSSKIEIICPMHGSFFQRAGGHIRGMGCKKCGDISASKMLTLNTDEFIKRAKLIHGDRYDYSLVDYKKANNAVIIICKKHGKFSQMPKSHIDKTHPANCPKCSKMKTTIEEFVKKARKIHGDKYDYSETIYNGAHKKLTIICPVHGKFEQRASSHTDGCGCSKCGDELRSKNRSSSTEEFIKKAKNAHGNTYDYSLVNYVNKRTKVSIICKKHGIFYQRPADHYSKGYKKQPAGCPKCAGQFKQEYSKNNIPLYETYCEKLESVGIKCRKDPSDKNVLQVICKLCKNWFIPDINSIYSLIKIINGKQDGNIGLYCSEQCKIICPLFRFNISHADKRSKLYTGEDETTCTRKLIDKEIKKNQCKKDGKMYCERCGNEIFDLDAERHHTLEVSKYGELAGNPNSHILVCVKCHLELHSECK